MVRNVQLRLTLKEEATPNGLQIRTAQYLGLEEGSFTLKVLRKSIDARKPKIVFNYKLAVYINEPAPNDALHFEYKDVSNAKPIHIVGFGPAGMWAALRCLEMGYKP
ncbi:MAG: FAD-binding protein, partial [Maribacter dokdonensis]